MPIFAVRATKAILALNGGAGTRRRSVALEGGGREAFVFGKVPLFFDVLPPEIAADRDLLVRELDEEDLPPSSVVIRLKRKPGSTEPDPETAEVEPETETTEPDPETETTEPESAGPEPITPPAPPKTKPLGKR